VLGGMSIQIPLSFLFTVNYVGDMCT